MIYQLIIAVLLGLCFINLLLNIIHIRRLSKTKSILKWPKVSILLPARNEEKRIKACLESLAKQDYPDFEVLVLNNSDDNTWEVAHEIAQRYPVIKVVQGLPQPSDWAGKNFACHQLSKLATGEWLLFVDADTTHEPGMLKGAISLAVKNNASLLSGFPHQITTSFAQSVIVPAFSFILFSWVPFWLPVKDNREKPNFAIGQFMLFPRKEYDRIGGHELIKNRLLDDVWLAIETGKAGGKVVTADLSRIVSCHMYESISDMWNGFGKSIYSVIAISPIGIFLAMSLGVCLWVFPFLNLWNQWNTQWMGGTLLSFILIIQVTLILITRLITDVQMSASWYSTLFHPIGILFYVVEVIFMSVRRIAGGGVKWKDCVYNSDSGVE
jgi:chlorobactene glucosyltransferase